jgi:hypothetical protein
LGADTRVLTVRDRSQIAEVPGALAGSTGHGNYPLDSPMLDPIVDLAEEFGWVVMCHTDIDSKVCNPHLGLRLARRHPGCSILFPTWV